MNEVTMEKLTSDFKALMDGVQELLKTASNQTGESIADLRQRLGQKLEEGRKALSEQERISCGKAEEARASAERTYARNPGLHWGLLPGDRSGARVPHAPP